MSFQGFWADIKDNKTLWVQIPIAFCALSLAAASAAFTISTLREDRNAHLVEIGIAILRADPRKEPSAASAREWALDLIDANAGGVKFSTQARDELMNQALQIKVLSLATDTAMGEIDKKLDETSKRLDEIQPGKSHP